jgi:hypothetical protein
MTATRTTEDWRGKIASLMEREGLLSEWEKNFLSSVASWRGAPSPKQQATITKIAARVSGRGLR